MRCSHAVQDIDHRKDKLQAKKSVFTVFPHRSDNCFGNDFKSGVSFYPGDDLKVFYYQ